MKDIVNRWSRFGKNRSLGLLLIRFGTGLVFGDASFPHE